MRLLNLSSMTGTKSWLNRLDHIIERNISDASLNNERLAAEISISERHLFRRVRDLTGLSPQKYLRQYRLHRAMQYLRNGKYRKVKEVAIAVGYINTSYFINQFEKEYGKKPLRVLQEAGWR